MRSMTCTAIVTIALGFMVGGCGNDDPSAPLSAFEPEIVNNPDSFEFQATGTENVTTLVDYLWDNSGTQATIDHSSVVTGGAGSVIIFDAEGSQVYEHELVASMNESTASGVPGTWTVRVVLADCDGTLNFRAEKL